MFYSKNSIFAPQDLVGKRPPFGGIFSGDHFTPTATALQSKFDFARPAAQIACIAKQN
jgi:hypothetical protein